MVESSPKEYKTVWDKEKLLITSNFPLSHSVFKSLVLQTRKKQGLFGKGLKDGFYLPVSKRLILEPFKLKASLHNKFKCGTNTLLLCFDSIENIMENGETSIFPISHNVLKRHSIWCFENASLYGKGL